MMSHAKLDHSWNQRVTHYFKKNKKSDVIFLGFFFSIFCVDLILVGIVGCVKPGSYTSDVRSSTRNICISARTQTPGTL
jgi:hypothetical protein